MLTSSTQLLNKSFRVVSGRERLQNVQKIQRSTCQRFQVWTRYNIISNIRQILTWIGFPAKFCLIFSVWFVRNVGFESSTNFRLSISYDLKAANIPWQCPFNNLHTGRHHWQSIEPYTLKRLDQSWIRNFEFLYYSTHQSFSNAGVQVPCILYQYAAASFIWKTKTLQ